MGNEPIVCADGFSMSVQASSHSYSTPRVDGALRYTHAEVGYPSEREILLMRWAEDEDAPTDTVYGYVPVQVIYTVCAKHGGILSGELPAGMPYLRARGVQ
jgi:hypothetical protein